MTTFAGWHEKKARLERAVSDAYDEVYDHTTQCRDCTSGKSTCFRVVELEKQFDAAHIAAEEFEKLGLPQ